MNKLITMTLAMSIFGCQDVKLDPLPVDYPDVLVVGDSQCDEVWWKNYTFPSYAGTYKNCKARRQLAQLMHPNMLYAPDTFNIIVMELGTNDASKHNDPVAYQSWLQNYKDYDSAHLLCLLPDRTDNIDIEPYRDAMVTVCDSTIDLRPLNIVGEDRVHYTHAGQKIIAQELVIKLEEIKND